MAGRTNEASRAATGDIIVTLDGDHSYPADALAYLLEAFLHLEVDFLNASRFPCATGTR
jgi:cellulose synthase/poly-beta-1,6-N-acetylglucosamine synthase-like glycosyltransferase